MLVSVIIPCYNSAGTVERAVASAFAQTYRPLEVICVDDGSTDATPNVLARLNAQYPDLVVIRQENGGAPVARNRGLIEAKGHYVQFLDADDELLPDKIDRQVAIAEKQQADMVVGSFRIRALDGGDVIREIERADPWQLLPRVRLGVTSANLFRREKVSAVGGWDEQLKSSQEYDLMFRLLKANACVAFDRTSATIMHRQQGSISDTNVRKNCLRRVEHLLEVRAYLSERPEHVDGLAVTNGALFEEIRHLANHDLSAALEAFRSYFPQGYQPTVSASTTESYVRLYRLLGFGYTERLRHWVHRLRCR